MKIAYVNFHYDVEGPSRGAAGQIRSLGAALERLGHEVHIRFLTPKPPGASDQPAGLRRLACVRRYGHVPRRLLRNGPLLRRQVALLEELRPDVLLAVGDYANCSSLLAARQCRVPCVLFCDAPLEYEFSTFYTTYYSYPWIGRAIEGLTVRRADQVVCVSEVLKAYLVGYGVPATRVHVVSNGVDDHAFFPSPADHDIITRYGLHDRLVVGFVGTFQFFSEVHGFIRSVQAVCRAHPRATFLFVGDGEARSRLEEEASAAGLADRLICTGGVGHADVPRYLSVMDIAIAPYRGDYLFYGSALKPLEYMAAGKPVVAPALGQIKELITSGYNGLLFEWDDSRTFERQLCTLLADEGLRARLGANARATIQEGWTWAAQAARLAKALEAARAGVQ